MKRGFFIFSFLILCSLQHAHAQQGGFGLGIILGAPTGISAKFWLSEHTAVDMAAAWAFRSTRRQVKSEIQFHANYLSHNFELFPVRKGKLPLYYGIGGRVNLGYDTRLSAPIPVGLNYLFHNAPLDIFWEIVPMLDLIPATEFKLDAAVGMRFWF